MICVKHVTLLLFWITCGIFTCQFFTCHVSIVEQADNVGFFMDVFEGNHSLTS